MRRGVIAGVLVAVALLMAGCAEKELYGGLTEREANEMVAVLQSAGVGASKASKDGKLWSLRTESGDFPRAVAVLHDQGYPRDKFESLGEVFKKEGFVSSPMEQRARLMYGLSQELSQTVSSIDGVVQARVHIAVPEADPLADEPKPSSASVFIRHNPDVDLSSQVGSIKALVTNSIEGLPYDRVTVVMFPARPVAAPPPTPAKSFTAPLLAILAAIVGVGLYIASRMRKKAPQPVLTLQPTRSSTT
ncbi:type III secretion inner membrane ring lipoprotein SctJ [Caulobacter sp.]|uniref:type III secretion system inner membrane ring lipoprotein SctJ n=1 Tax=Caulobacter sp. TaxID=78 RepID=UPI00160C3E5B